MKSIRLKKAVFILFFVSSLLALASFFLAIRDISIGADSVSYGKYFFSVQSCGCLGEYEPLFGLLTYLVAVAGLSLPFYFFSISSFIFLMAFFIAVLSASVFTDLKKKAYLGEAEFAKLAVFIVFLMMVNPLFFQAHVNAIRHGISALLLILGFLLYHDSRQKLSVLVILSACFFHYSSFMYAPLIFILFLGKRAYAFILIIFTLSSFMYLFGYSEYFLKLVSYDIWYFIKNYGVTESWRLKDGLRLDFYFFNFTLILTGIIGVSQLEAGLFKSKAIDFLMFLIVLSIPFNFFGWGYFSNRYLYSTWIWVSVLSAPLFFYFFRLYKFSTSIFLCFLFFIVIYYLYKVGAISF